MYFTVDHEQAILKFCTSEDRAEKEKLYIDLIQPAFNQMVDKIVFSYKFTNLPNIDELRREGISVLLVEQNARLSLARSNRGYIFSGGKVVHTGNAKNILDDPNIGDYFLGLQ